MARTTCHSHHYSSTTMANKGKGKPLPRASDGKTATELMDAMVGRLKDGSKSTTMQESIYNPNKIDFLQVLQPNDERVRVSPS